MMNGLGMGLWWLWVLVLVVGLAALVWGLASAVSAGGRGGSRPGSPREILRERYARGEISEDELRERLRVLDDH